MSTSVVSPSELASRKPKKTKKKTADKWAPFLSSKFDEHSFFDVFDFMQFKTQMKIVKLRREQQSGHEPRLKIDKPAQIPKSKKLKPLASKTLKQKNSAKKTTVKRKVPMKEIEAFMKQNDSVKSVKKARAMIKTKEFIIAYLEKHPEIPVEKSHRRMTPLKKPDIRKASTIPSREVEAPVTHSKMLSALTQQVKAENTSAKISPIVEAGFNASSVLDMDGQMDDSMKVKPDPMVSSSGAPTQDNIVTSASMTSTTKNGQVDHVAAINSWIQKNYHKLSATQKQLVHMQLQYLNNLKKTYFQNQAFILSPQHLNNLNNLAFLNAHFNPFNSNYTNFVNVPSYSVDVNKNIQLLQALQQQQRNFQMPVNPGFQSPSKRTNSDAQSSPVTARTQPDQTASPQNSSNSNNG